MKRDRHPAVLSPVMVHDQIVGNTIEPGPKWLFGGAVPGKAGQHTSEDFACQVFRLAIMPNPQPYIAVDDRLVTVIENAYGGDIPILSLFYQIRVTHIPHFRSRFL
jgi:hypothetical protein